MAKKIKTPTTNVFKTIVREVVRDELLDMEERLEANLDAKLDEKIKNLPTKEEFFSTTDQIMGELKTIREEQTMHQGQHDEVTDRLEKLESIHPSHQHH